MAKRTAKTATAKVPVKNTTAKTVRRTVAAAKPAKSVFRTDSKQVAVLERAGRTSASNAIRASKALGLSITYMQKGVIYKEHTDGTKEVIVSIGSAKSATKSPKTALKKGMVLYAKK